jgi:hypothetical protein
MFREIRVELCALVASGLLLAARGARADERPAAPVYVLALSTDDADDQAEALTAALRARVDALPTWALQETSQSFETLSIALRCPARPDGACLERIGDHLHADHYVWGSMSRGRGDVAVEVNLWSRDGAGAKTSATFPDNLKDPESPRLRAVAVRLLESLLGSSAEEPPAVRGKAASVPTPVPAPVGATPATPATPAPEPATHPSQSSNAPKVLGYAGIASGVVLLVAGGLEWAKWSTDKNAANQQRAMVPAHVTDVCAAPGNAAAAGACQATTRETNDAILVWVFTVASAALGGTGAWLLIASGGSGAGRPATARLPIELVPTIGAHVRSLDLRLTF